MKKTAKKWEKIEKNMAKKKSKGGNRPEYVEFDPKARK